jgi:hypothetical protein
VHAIPRTRLRTRLTDVLHRRCSTGDDDSVEKVGVPQRSAAVVVGWLVRFVVGSRPPGGGVAVGCDRVVARPWSMPPELALVNEALCSVAPGATRPPWVRPFTTS